MRTLIKMTVDSDLSEYALDAAYQDIKKWKKDNNIRGGYRILRVPSQSIGNGIILSKYIHARIEVSTSYALDEWSLEYHLLKAGEEIICMVHTNGA